MMLVLNTAWGRVSDSCQHAREVEHLLPTKYFCRDECSRALTYAERWANGDGYLVGLCALYDSTERARAAAYRALWLCGDPAKQAAVHAFLSACEAAVAAIKATDFAPIEATHMAIEAMANATKADEWTKVALAYAAAES